MSSTVDQLDLFADDDFDLEAFEAAEAEAARERKRAKRRQWGKPNYRKKLATVPVKGGVPFVIVPEIAPILEGLASLAAREAGLKDNDGEISGISILGARAAIVMQKNEDSVVRRLHAVIGKAQLFINAPFVEACLMAMDAEHEHRYGEWPSSRADALERVSIAAEMAGKNVSPSRLLAQGNRLYEKGLRKALKHAPEVNA